MNTNCFWGSCLRTCSAGTLPCSLLAVADFKLSGVLRTQEGESVPVCSRPCVNTALGLGEPRDLSVLFFPRGVGNPCVWLGSLTGLVLIAKLRWVQKHTCAGALVASSAASFQRQRKLTLATFFFYRPLFALHVVCPPGSSFWWEQLGVGSWAADCRPRLHLVAGRQLCLLMWETELRFLKFGEDVKRWRRESKNGYVSNQNLLMLKLPDSNSVFTHQGLMLIVIYLHFLVNN